MPSAGRTKKRPEQTGSRSREQVRGMAPGPDAVPYRRIFETAPDGMLLADAASGTVVQVNGALTDLSGYRAGDIRGKKLWDIPPLRATDAGQVVFRELQKQKRIYYDELPLERRDGERITVELICSMHEMDRIKMIQCTFRDVTKYVGMKQELQSAEARFQALFRQAGTGIALLDPAGRFVEGNAKLCGMLGYEANELGGRSLEDIVARSAPDMPVELMQEVREVRQEPVRLAQQCLRKDGTGFWALLSLSSVAGADGTRQFLILTMVDISDRKQAEESVINSRDFFRSLIFELPNPIRITGTDGTCEYVNKAWLDFRGVRLDQEIGEGWEAGLHAEDRQRVREVRTGSFDRRAPYVTEYRLSHRSGVYRWLVEFGRPFNDMYGAFAGYLSSCYDVHERKEFEKRLHSISFTDDLTGLLNRRGFFAVARQQLKQANRTHQKHLFLFADLDGLKKINDTQGHQQGDQALAEAAEILREVFRESDIIARLGGDEFAVLMAENAGAGEENAVMDRLRGCIDEHNARPGRQFTLSVSTGIKQYDPSRPCTLDELISKADRLMYEEKKSKQTR